MNILYAQPFRRDKNIGQYYNWCMSLIGNEDWCCFTDMDAQYTTVFVGNQIEDIIRRYPECRCFTAVTNRVGCPWQKVGDWKNDDMKYHYDLSSKLYKSKYSEIIDKSNPDKKWVMSGVLILVKKSLWLKVGGFKTKGALGVDNDFHWKLMHHNEKLYLMTGVYIYHWYRGGNSAKHKHLV